MAYNSMFPVNYQTYPAAYNPSVYMSQNQQTQQPSSSLIWVQGEAGAKSYLVGAGQSVLLMDSESNAFFIKSTDASGMPLPLRIFDYTERVQQNGQSQVITHQESREIDTSNFVTREEFNQWTTNFKASLKASKREATDGE